MNGRGDSENKHLITDSGQNYWHGFQVATDSFVIPGAIDSIRNRGGPLGRHTCCEVHGYSYTIPWWGPLNWFNPSFMMTAQAVQYRSLLIVKLLVCFDHQGEDPT